MEGSSSEPGYARGDGARTRGGSGLPETPAERIRAQSKEATRRALLESGLTLLIEAGGLRMPSIESICSRAGYTRGAFYVHFQDRDEFDVAILQWVLDDIVRSLFVVTEEGTTSVGDVVRRFKRALEAGEMPDVRQNVRAGYLAILRELRSRPAVRRRHAELMMGIHRRLEEQIADEQRAGSLRDDVDAAHMAMLLLLTAIGAIMWDDVDIPVENEVLGEALVRLIGGS